MARPKNVVPAYLLHKPSGQARVRINGKDYYLGAYGSEESRRKYGELVARHGAGKPVDPFVPAAPADIGPSVAEVCLAFLNHAEGYYVKHGKATDEVACIRGAVKALAGLYGLKPIKALGPNDLRAVQAAMVGLGWSRTFINHQVSRIRRMVRWAVSREMVPATVLAGLSTLEPLVRGKTSARETRRRATVPDDVISATKAKIRSRIVKSLIDLQRITGARSGELVILTTAMIDRTGDVWRADLEHHKTAHRGQQRVLFFGPRAQQILTPWLRDDAPGGKIFNIRRDNFANAIRRACRRANVSPWTPHELRHTRLTELRDQIGVEAAQATAGHSRADMTCNYTRNLSALAERTAKEQG